MTTRFPIILPEGPRLLPLGDSGLLVSFGQDIAPDINDRVFAFTREYERTPSPGTIEVVPTFSAIAIYFDPTVIAMDQLAQHLIALFARPWEKKEPQTRLIEIPVLYDAANGPDLATVAEESGVSTQEVVAFHQSVEYRVYMLGFTPGFPYLGSVPEVIAVPRLAEPRTSVPAGSIGLAGRQTGIYPQTGPGGWRIIGRTPFVLFDPTRRNPFFFKAGDRVRFRAINRKEFDRLAEKQ